MRQVNRILAMLLIVLIAMQVGAREAKDFKYHKEVKVTGKNLLIPVVFPDFSLG